MVSGVQSWRRQCESVLSIKALTILTLSLRGVYHWGVMDALENAKREVLSILGFFSIKIVGNNSITSQNSWIKQKCQAVPRSYLKKKNYMREIG